MSKYIKKDENGLYVFDEIEFSKTLPTGLEYFAVDRETEQIYNLGFNYKEKMEKQISDLEAKLAELREQITICDEENSKTFMKSVNAMRENAELKQQLAMQENTITNLVEDNRASQEWYKKQLAEKDKEIMEFASKVDLLESEKENLFRTLEEANEEHQDKISFCIEQLEKVKELMFSIWQKSCGEELLISGIETIDNQIKQLKEIK